MPTSRSTLPEILNYLYNTSPQEAPRAADPPRMPARSRHRRQDSAPRPESSDVPQDDEELPLPAEIESLRRHVADGVGIGRERSDAAASADRANSYTEDRKQEEKSNTFRLHSVFPPSNSGERRIYTWVRPPPPPGIRVVLPSDTSREHVVQLPLSTPDLVQELMRTATEKREEKKYAEAAAAYELVKDVVIPTEIRTDVIRVAQLGLLICYACMEKFEEYDKTFGDMCKGHTESCKYRGCFFTEELTIEEIYRRIIKGTGQDYSFAEKLGTDYLKALPRGRRSWAIEALMVNVYLRTKKYKECLGKLHELKAASPNLLHSRFVHMRKFFDKKWDSLINVCIDGLGMEKHADTLYKDETQLKKDPVQCVRAYEALIDQAPTHPSYFEWYYRVGVCWAANAKYAKSIDLLNLALSKIRARLRAPVQPSSPSRINASGPTANAVTSAAASAPAASVSSAASAAASSSAASSASAAVTSTLNNKEDAEPTESGSAGKTEDPLKKLEDKIICKLGNVYLKIENYIDAQKMFKVAVESRPDERDRWWNLHLTEYKLGNLGMTYKALARYAALCPQERDKRAAVQKMEKLTIEIQVKEKARQRAEESKAKRKRAETEAFEISEEELDFTLNARLPDESNAATSGCEGQPASDSVDSASAATSGISPKRSHVEESDDSKPPPLKKQRLHGLEEIARRTYLNTYALKCVYDQLTAIQTSVKEQAKTDALKCILCTVNQMTTRLQCGHVYCGECANKVQNCPSCRAVISKREPVYI